MNINQNTYFCQLPREIQDKLKIEITKALQEQGHDEDTIKETMENVEVDRIWILSDLIDINKYINEANQLKNTISRLKKTKE